MKSTPKRKLILLLILGFVFGYSQSIRDVCDRRSSYKECDDAFITKLNLSKVSRRIHIVNNWSDTKAAGLCTGSGSYVDPYVIENLMIDGGVSESCILIENSTVYFKIENCTVYNSTENNMVGILLSHVNNSLLINNNSSSNEGGIILRYCSNNTIVNNIVTNNSFGIILFRSSNNRISENYVNENYNGEGSIGLIKSHNNTISGNYASDNREGIDLWESHDNLITENTLENNNAGIRISESDNNIISQNNLTSIPRFNGILLGSGNFNLIYLNCLTTFINAKDYGFNNSWDNGIKGNYWDDYRGSDDDNNRIGDVPYEIFFSNGSQDNFPLMNCPLPLTEGDEGIMWYDILTLIGSLALVIVITGFIIQKQRKTRVK